MFNWMKKLAAFGLALLLVASAAVHARTALADDLSAETLRQNRYHLIGAGWDHSAAVTGDHRVAYTGGHTGNSAYSINRKEVTEWTDIVAIAGAADHIVGLKSNGTVVASGCAAGTAGVGGWSNIVAIDAAQDQTIGLRADGTVCVTGGAAPDWQDIVAVTCGGLDYFGLRRDGTVVYACQSGDPAKYSNVDAWRGIVAIQADFNYVMALRDDGTVAVSRMSDNTLANEVTAWQNVVAIDAGPAYAVGVTKTGGVLVARVGRDVPAAPDTSNWHKIVEVAAGFDHIVGLKADGTVVCTKDASTTYLREQVSGWSGVGDEITQRGSSGDSVVRLQTALRDAGYLPPSEQIDGKFGPNTEAAVNAAKADFGLEQDGVAGLDLQILLYTTGA